MCMLLLKKHESPKTVQVKQDLLGQSRMQIEMQQWNVNVKNIMSSRFGFLHCVLQAFFIKFHNMWTSKKDGGNVVSKTNPVAKESIMNLAKRERESFRFLLKSKESKLCKTVLGTLSTRARSKFKQVDNDAPFSVLLFTFCPYLQIEHF